MNSDTVLLIGAEQVQLAAGRIEGAATTIRGSADSFEQTIQRHEVFLTDWLSRLELVINQAVKP